MGQGPTALVVGAGTGTCHNISFSIIFFTIYLITLYSVIRYIIENYGK